jgi:hypothetical protein
MDYYATDLRDVFLEWLDSGRPAMATMDVDYAPTQIPAIRLLGDLAECTDELPPEYSHDVDEFVGEGSYDGTYGSAARVLLAAHGNQR